MRPIIVPLCLALLAAASPARAQPPAETASEALIDQFVRALPHQEELEVHPAVDPRELARLAAINPGRESALRPILMAHATCTASPQKAATIRLIRVIARDLGPAKLARLIAFYQGPDYATFERLSATADGRQTPPQADRKEIERIMAAYPLADWIGGMGRAAGRLLDDSEFLDATTRCDAARDAALAQAKLRSR